MKGAQLHAAIIKEARRVAYSYDLSHFFDLLGRNGPCLNCKEVYEGDREDVEPCPERIVAMLNDFANTVVGFTRTRRKKRT